MQQTRDESFGGGYTIGTMTWFTERPRCPDGRVSSGVDIRHRSRPGAAQIVGRGRTPRNLAPTLPAK
jgi:hypothetical protein